MLTAFARAHGNVFRASEVSEIAQKGRQRRLRTPGRGAKQGWGGKALVSHISWGHSFPANTEQIHIFPGFSQLLV